MEAVPKLTMVQFYLKYSPENTDFLLKLKKLIHTHYQEDPDSFNKELNDIGTLRSNACIRPTHDFAGIAAVKKYYCQLNFLQNRFKIKGGTEDGIFAFPWYDAYSGALYTFSDLHYEMASVLYNIGALHSILGSREDRSTSEGMKVACTHFQCAAWAFHTLPDRYHTDGGTDMSADLLAFLSQVCLAQAQECILEKSILDHRKASIIAKVGAQVADYYKQAFRKIESSNSKADSLTAEETISEIVGSKVSKAWTKYVEFKMTYYTSVSYLYQGLQSEESQKMGERIAYYEKASELLIASGKLAKNLDSDVIGKTLLANCLTFSSDVINGKLEISKKENEFVYHEKVPDFDSLPELKGASLVKGMGFDVTDPEVSGPDIFARLVPLEAHEASSLYSEEKAQLLRSVGSEVDAKDGTLEIFLSSLSLSEVPKPGDHLSLPQELIEAAAGLSVQKDDVVKKLIDAMASIASVAADVEANIKQIREYLEEEDHQKSEYTAIVGDRPSPINSDLDRECQKYEEAHRMASESNATLHKAMRLHIDNLRLLAKPLDQLQKEIPSMADLDEASEANIAEVHRLLAKIEQMKEQRAMLHEQFRNSVHEDDITKKLVVHKGKDMDEIFKIELQKHDQKRKILQQNLLAQDNILQALTETNARYATTRRIVAELINARTELIGSLVASFYAHDDLLQKASKGLEFYTKLNENVLKLLNRVRSFCKVQQEERDAVLAKHHDKMARKTAKQSQHENFAPGAPPFLDNLDLGPGVPMMMETVPSGGGGGSGGRPTLKDYLDMMKANKMPPAGQQNNQGEGPKSMSYTPSTTTDPKPSHLQQQSQFKPTYPQGYQYPGGVPYSQYPGSGGQQSYYQQPAASTSQVSMDQAAGIGSSESGSQHPPSSQTPPDMSGGNKPPSENPINNSGPSYPSNQGDYSSQHQATVSNPSSQTQMSNLQATIAATTASNFASYHTAGSVQPSSNTNPRVSASPTKIQQPGVQQPGNPNQVYPYPAQAQFGYTYPGYQFPAGQQPVYSSMQYQFPQGQQNIVGAKPQFSQQQVSQPANQNYQNMQDPGMMAQNPIQKPSTQFQQSQVGQPGGNQNYQTPQNQMTSQATAAQGQNQATQGSGGQQPQTSGQNIYQGYPMQQGQTGSQAMGPNPLTQFPMCQTTGSQGYAFQPGAAPQNVLGANQSNQFYPGQASIRGFHPQQSQSPAGQQQQQLFQPQDGNTSKSTPAQGQNIPQPYPYSQGQMPMPQQTVQARPTQFVANQVPQGQQHPQTLQFQGQVGSQAGVQGYQGQAPQAVSTTPITGFQQAYTTTYAANSQANNPTYTMPQQFTTTYPASVGGKSYAPQTFNNAAYGYMTNLAGGQTQTGYGTNAPTVTQSSTVNNQQQATNVTQTQVASQSTTVNTTTPQPMGYGYQPQQQRPAITGLTPQQSGYPMPVFPAALEPKLRAVVPQPGTVPPQQYLQGSQPFQQPMIATRLPLQPVGGLLQPQSQPSTPDHQRRTSLDELLGDGPKASSEASVVLQPKVMTASELEELKNEAQAREDIAKACAKDPYEDPANQQRLLSELNDLETLINDKSSLEAKWREVLNNAELGTKRTISVARCYPMKNRVPDVMPFDQTRVELPATKDDYINASRIKQLTTHSPKFVATQSPTPNTLTDFWMMVWQEQVETMICLVPDVPDVYWPTERKEPLQILKSLEVTLQSMKTETSWTERIFTLLNKETNTSKVVIHIHLNQNSTTHLMENMVSLASTSLGYVRQQRVLTHPVLVHCLDGSGKTALFILLASAMAEIKIAGQKSDKIIPDMVQVASTLSQQRKGILRDKEHFKQALNGIAKFARDLLVKKGAIQATPIVQQRAPEPKGNDIIQADSNLSLLASHFNFDSSVAFNSMVLPQDSTGLAPHEDPMTLINPQDSMSLQEQTEKPKFFTADLSRLADLSLEPFPKSIDGVDVTGSPRRKKITKQDFLNADKNKGSCLMKSEADPDDPLSQLDPLWSLK